MSPTGRGVRKLIYLKQGIDCPLRWLVCKLPLVVLAALSICPAFGQTEPGSLTQRRWFEARTAHFNIYSCGPTQEVARVVARLEQFRDAYSLLAGAQAVA